MIVTALPLTSDRREGLTDIQQFGKVKIDVAEDPKANNILNFTKTSFEKPENLFLKPGTEEFKY